MTAGIHAHTGDQIGAGSGTVDAEFPLDVSSGVIVEVAEHDRFGWLLVNCSTDQRGHRCPPFGSCLRVTVEPFARLAGLRVAAVCLCLLKGQTTLDDPIPLLKVGSKGADDVVEGHRLGCLVA
jgi:hypothetical protein